MHTSYELYKYLDILMLSKQEEKKWLAYKSGLTVPLEDYATILILTLIHNSNNIKFVFPQIHQSSLTKERFSFLISISTNTHLVSKVV